MDNQASIVTIDKIIEKSKQWTLEGDCTLLQWMDQISKNLEERVTRTNSALTEMATRLDRTSVALSNATNNLAALQYSQFVENRVHDDDETLANIAEVPTPSADVTDDKDVNHNVYSFLKKNLEMMNSCHEAYSISYDDSDEDEPATNVVYRSKNPYEARALPHIYGSTLWKEKWHIGLCDSDNDFSGDEESEQFSESSSTDDESYESTAPTMSEWDSTAWGLNTSHLPGRKDSHTPSNDGESSCQGDNFSQSEASTPRAQRVLPIVQPAQDQRYYQHIPRKEGNQFHDIFNDSEEKVAPKVVAPSPTTTTAERKMPSIPQASLIADEPPPDEESVESDTNRRIGAKKPLNLFDDDEFSSFMDQIVQTANNKSGKVGNTTKESPNKKVVTNLFDDSGYIVQASTKSVDPAENTLKKAVIPNLFDEPEEIPPATSKSNKPVAPKLFNDSEDIASQPKKTQEPSKKPVIPNLFDDSDDMFTGISEPSVSKKTVASPTLEDDIFQPPPMPAVLERTKIRNLFDDDDDDDDFERIFAAKPSGVNKFAQKTNNLFDDDLGDRFGEESTSENPIPENEDVPVVRKEVKEMPFLKKGLFDEDEDDFLMEKDIFSKKPVEKNSFEDIFSKETKKKTVKSMSGLESDLFSDVKQDGTISNMSAVNDSVKRTGLETDPSGKTLSLEESHQNDLGLKSEMEGPAPTVLKSVEEVDEVVTTPPSQQVNVQRISKTVPITSKAGSLAKMDLFADDVHDKTIDENVAILKAKTNSKVEAVFDDDFKKIEPNPDSSEVNDLVTKIVETPNDMIVEPHPKLPEMSGGPTVSVEANVPPESSARSEKKKINVADIFADDFTDDFDELIPKLGMGKANEAPIPENRDMEEAAAKASHSIAIGSDKPKPTSELSSGKMASKVADIFGDDFTDEDEFIPNLKGNNSNELEKSKMLASTKLPDIAQKPTLSKPEDRISAALVNKKSQNELLTTDAEAVDPKDLLESSPPSTSKDHLLATTEQPTTKVPIYSTLFHDEPPPDDDNQLVPTYEEPSSDDDSNETTLTKAAYNSINLFADVPPDDDFPTVAPAETKRIHSIFYDDFHETMEASREMRAPSSYMFNDEPPPDDTDDDAQSAKKDTKEQTKVVEEKKERPKVSKLKKTDLHINVGALLPKAKIPLFKKSESETVSKATVSDDEVPRTSVKSPERHLPDNILPNLNRDRAKVQVRRRPSTRKGRQESYRKSIIDDKVIAVEQERDNSKENDLKKTTSLFEEVGAFGTSVVEEFKSRTTVQEIPKLATSKIPIFSEDPDTGAGDMLKANLPKPPEIAKIMDSLFDSDGVDENPFGTPTKTIETPPQSVATIKEVTFKSNDVPTAVPPAFKSVNPSSKSTSLFGESDDGSDDLFNESKTHKKLTPQKTIEKHPTPKAVSQPTKAASSLFSSDEESGSGDDVFGKSKAKAAPKKINKTISKPSSSLFASDDDDDDLFGTTKKKPSAVDKSRPKTTTTRVHPSKTPALAQQKQTSISNNPLSDLLGP